MEAATGLILITSLVINTSIAVMSCWFEDRLPGGSVLAEVVVTRTVRPVATAAPSPTYTAARQVSDFGATQPALTLAIAQISAFVGRGINARATL